MKRWVHRCSTPWQARRAKELTPQGAGNSPTPVLRQGVPLSYLLTPQLCVLPGFPDTHCNTGLTAHHYQLPSFCCITSSFITGFPCTYQVHFIPSILISRSAEGRTHTKTCMSEIATPFTLISWVLSEALLDWHAVCDQELEFSSQPGFKSQHSFTYCRFAING